MTNGSAGNVLSKVACGAEMFCQSKFSSGSETVKAAAGGGPKAPLKM